MEKTDNSTTIMIDGKLVDYAALNLEELEELEEKLIKQQQDIRDKIDAWFDK